MAAIFNLAILDSDTLLSSLRFTQKLSHSSLTLTQTNSIWLTWRWQPSGNVPSWILPTWIQPICTKKNLTHSFWLNLMMAAILNSAILNLAILYSAILIFSFKLTHTFQDWFPPFSQNILLIHSDSTWWWQPSWLSPCWVQTLPSWIQTPCYLLSDSLKNTLTPLWLWL